jgi:hypothetical protein
MLPLARALLFSWAVLAAFGSSRQTARDDSDYTVLPVVFDGRYGYPSVPVTIQATRIPLAFDLGGSKLELALSPALLRQHGIAVSYTGKVVHGEDARGVKSTYREFILPEVHLADFALENIRGIEYHPWGGRGAPKNGIVGFDLIAKFNVVIDFSKSRIALIRGTTFPPGYDVAAWPKVPFTADGHMLTEATVNGRSIRLLWDTGTPVSSIKTTIKLAGDVQNCSRIVLFKLASNPRTCKKITTPDFVMHGHDFGHMIFHTRSMPGLPADGMVGDEFFQDHTVYIDFTNRIAAIEPRSLAHANVSP